MDNNNFDSLFLWLRHNGVFFGQFPKIALTHLTNVFFLLLPPSTNITVASRNHFVRNGTLPDHRKKHDYDSFHYFFFLSASSSSVKLLASNKPISRFVVIIFRFFQVWVSLSLLKLRSHNYKKQLPPRLPLFSIVYFLPKVVRHFDVRASHKRSYFEIFAPSPSRCFFEIEFNMLFRRRPPANFFLTPLLQSLLHIITTIAGCHKKRAVIVVFAWHVCVVLLLLCYFLRLPLRSFRCCCCHWRRRLPLR